MFSFAYRLTAHPVKANNKIWAFSFSLNNSFSDWQKKLKFMAIIFASVKICQNHSIYLGSFTSRSLIVWRPFVMMLSVVHILTCSHDGTFIQNWIQARQETHVYEKNWNHPYDKDDHNLEIGRKVTLILRENEFLDWNKNLYNCKASRLKFTRTSWTKSFFLWISQICYVWNDNMFAITVLRSNLHKSWPNQWSFQKKFIKLILLTKELT